MKTLWKIRRSTASSWKRWETGPFLEEYKCSVRCPIPACTNSYLHPHPTTLTGQGPKGISATLVQVPYRPVSACLVILLPDCDIRRQHHGKCALGVGGGLMMRSFPCIGGKCVWVFVNAESVTIDSPTFCWDFKCKCSWKPEPLLFKSEHCDH